MKNLTHCFLLLAAMLCPSSTSAELLIFKGAETDNVIGEYNGARFSLRLIYIVDHDTANVGRVSYYTFHGNKRYSTSTLTNVHFVTVTGPNSKTYTVVSRVRTDCELDAGAKGEGVYFAGLNATLKSNTNSTTIFPRTISDSGQGLSFRTDSGEPLLTGGSLN